LTITVIRSPLTGVAACVDRWCAERSVVGACARQPVFARHSNPWGAWSKWATAPLVLVPVRTRRWSHTSVVAAWFAINPVIFPKPADDRAWATLAMLGEGQWLVDRPWDADRGLNVVASAAGLTAVIAAHRR
jgi:uncharacterized protein DUF6653